MMLTKTSEDAAPPLMVEDNDDDDYHRGQRRLQHQGRLRERTTPKVVLATVDLQKRNVATCSRSETKPSAVQPVMDLDVMTLSEHLPEICRTIFQQIGSQQTESTYQNCLMIDLEESGLLRVDSEPEIQLTYKNVVVGTRRPDVVVTDKHGRKAVLELKAVNEMTANHMQQLEFYLHYADIDVGYLINFPHDASFQNVDDESSFRVDWLAGLKSKMVTILSRGRGPTLRLRNSPEKRDIEILKVTRRKLSPRERAQVAAARKREEDSATQGEPATATQPQGVFGITQKGLPCKICIKEQKFCKKHISQQPASNSGGSLD